MLPTVSRLFVLLCFECLRLLAGKRRQSFPFAFSPAHSFFSGCQMSDVIMLSQGGGSLLWHHENPYNWQWCGGGGKQDQLDLSASSNVARFYTSRALARLRV